MLDYCEILESDMCSNKAQSHAYWGSRMNRLGNHKSTESRGCSKTVDKTFGFKAFGFVNCGLPKPLVVEINRSGAPF